MAADQRYCLNCGVRRGDSRVDFDELVGGSAGGVAPPPAGPAAAPPPAERPNDFSPLGAVLGVAVLGAMLLIGVLIGRGDSDDVQQAPVVAAAPGETAAGGSSENVSATEVETTWPDGKEGWTVELGTVANDSPPADVEAARSDIEGKGAPDVGILDSDDFASLPGGNYVIYSGVYDNEKDADAALKDLQGDYPDAQVIEVSSEAGGGGEQAEGILAGKAGEGQSLEATEEDLQQLDATQGRTTRTTWTTSRTRSPPRVRLPPRTTRTPAPAATRR